MMPREMKWLPKADLLKIEYLRLNIELDIPNIFQSHRILTGVPGTQRTQSEHKGQRNNLPFQLQPRISGYFTPIFNFKSSILNILRPWKIQQSINLTIDTNR